MTGTDIELRAHDGGAFSAYLALPSKRAAPGLVLIQEIFGVNPFMRGVAERLAGYGYAVICPDIFWRQEPGVQLSDKTEEDFAKAFRLMQGFDIDLGVRDLITAMDYLRSREDATGRVGATGYCLGGQLTYLMACRSSVDAAVGYYGVFIQDFLEEAANISHPLMLHIAEEDEFVPKDAQEAIRSALKDNPNVTLQSYPGVNHAFAREGGQHYNKDAATRANKRSLDFFNTYLK